jgi:hydroxymethylglutaryl-CoA reductase
MYGNKRTEEPKSTSLDGFSKLSREQRYQKLLELNFINPVEYEFLRNEMPMDPHLADHFIENALGYYKLPMGVAVHFNINGKDMIIPMVVEETSIIAAASKTAKWIKKCGEIKTRSIGQEIIGQIQFGKVKDPDLIISKVLKSKKELIDKGNQIASGMYARGGGVTDISARSIQRPDGAFMVVFHVLLNPCDAMGANVINQVCEGLKPLMEELTQEKVTMCILSNLVDTKLTEVKIRIRNIDPAMGHAIEEASLFAQLDPYRAATNNKGVMNGVDAVLLATGRAVEAGVHAYAVKDGKYRSITEWHMTGPDLVGTFRAPIVVGTVGGVTQLHPAARLNLNILGVKTAEELSHVAGTVGLVQNLGALKALSSVGIVQGHMRLHSANLAMQAGATPQEMEDVQKELQVLLDSQRKISVMDAKEVLEKIRKQK